MQKNGRILWRMIKQHLKGFSHLYTLFLSGVLVNFVGCYSKSIFMHNERRVMSDTAHAQQSI